MENVYKSIDDMKSILSNLKMDGKTSVDIDTVINQLNIMLANKSNDSEKNLDNGETVKLKGGLEYLYIGKHPIYPKFSCCLRKNTTDYKAIEIFDTSFLTK